MTEDNGASPTATGLSSATPIEPVPVSPVPASIPSAAELKYLRDHHHIAESMIGILMLHATNGQKKAVQRYSDELDLLHINRLLDCGVPVENIGERGVFYHPDHLVAQAIEARRAATGTGAVHESAVPQGCAQGDQS